MSTAQHQPGPPTLSLPLPGMPEPQPRERLDGTYVRYLDALIREADKWSELTEPDRRDTFAALLPQYLPDEAVAQVRELARLRRAYWAVKGADYAGLNATADAVHAHLGRMLDHHHPLFRNGIHADRAA